MPSTLFACPLAASRLDMPLVLLRLDYNALSKTYRASFHYTSFNLGSFVEQHSVLFFETSSYDSTSVQTVFQTLLTGNRTQ